MVGLVNIVNKKLQRALKVDPSMK